MPFQLQDELPGGSKTAEDEEVGLVTSALAGVYTGLWNIPKGFFSFQRSNNSIKGLSK